MKRAYGILALVIVAMFGIAVVTRLSGRGDDKTQIQESLRESLEASRKGQPGKVLDALSGKFKFNDQDAGGYGGKISEYIRGQKPEITVENQEPIITGDEARITSPVQIHVSVPLIGDKTVTVKDVVMVFHKETAQAFLVIPVSKWRLAEVQAPDFSMGSIGIGD